jgi:hypothetical protein
MNLSNAIGDNQSEEMSPIKIQKKGLLRRSSSVESINKNLASHAQLINSIDNLEFNIFELQKGLGRDHTMSLVGWKIMENLNLIEIVNEEKLACFLDKIYLTYSRDIQYHNDLHGADVAQMSYRMLT